MPNEVDKSLLDRLAALRGPSASPPSRVVSSASIDPIERRRTPTREEALADRLKRLREGSASPAASHTTPSPHPKAAKEKQVSRPEEEEKGTKSALASEKTLRPAENIRAAKDAPAETEEEEDSYFQTDDAELEELLGDVHHGDPPPAYSEPTDQEVKDLLEQLSASVPQDDGGIASREQVSDHDRDRGPANHSERGDSDDSEGEGMKQDVDDVMARYKDEIELDKHATHQEEHASDSGEETASEEETSQTSDDHPPIELPSVPTTSTSQHTSAEDTTIDSLTSRLFALRNTNNENSSSNDILPSVPSTAPTKEPNRLTSRTGYTDADAETWCVVCLEDATLRCLGCEGEPYCARCWREMHVGERAGYEERGHKAVEFGKKRRKKKVAVGAA